MFGLGPMEMVLVFLIILLVFGAKRIPEIAQGLGKGINEFKKAARDVTNELDSNSQSQQNTVKNELKGTRQEESRPSQNSDQQKNNTTQG